MGDFRQRVGLVHELRQLRRAEEFTHRGRRRFGVDQVLRHHRVDLDRRHPLLDRTFHPQQANAILVLHQFANRAHPAVAEVIDIVDVAFAVPQFHQRLDAGDDIIAIQRALSIRFIEIQPHVHLDPANGREVIAFGIKEQCIKERRRGLFGGRLAGAHDAVDVHERALAVHVLVRRHGVANIGTDVDAVDVENRNICDPGIKQILKRTPGDFAILAVLQRQLIARLDIDRASFLVDDIARHEFADDMLEGNQELGYIPLVDQLLDRARCDLFARFKNHFAGVGIDQVIGGAGAADTLWEELGDPALFLFQLVIYGVVIGIHDAFLIETERIKQRRHR